MATATTLVPLETYLSTSYEHDCEWVDGELRERGMPDGYHGYFQDLLLGYFNRLHVEFGLRALPEIRIRVSETRYRIPDVLVIPSNVSFLPTVTVTPLLCIEILSPDDGASDLDEKVADYLAMGVGTVWVVDPRRRVISTADGQGIYPVQVLRLLGTSVKIMADELFAGLDRYEKL